MRKETDKTTKTATNADILFLMDKTKQIRKSNKALRKQVHQYRRRIVNVLIGFAIVWCFIAVYIHTSIGSLTDSSNSVVGPGDGVAVQVGGDLPPQKGRDLAVPKTTGRDKGGARQDKSDVKDHEVKNNKNDDNKNNPWYGWQPSIISKMECSWRECFKDGHNEKNNNKCATSCRDSLEDWGEAPPAADDWVPDVTMLKRMYIDGHDSNGNPWPPPLDEELCENIGARGGQGDDNILLLRSVPIQAQPFTHQGRKLLCLVYTMENIHPTNIRSIRETWGPGCDGFLAFSTRSDPRIPAISVPHDGKEEYNNMWQKVRSIWRYVGQHYLEDFDFFYLGGEDMFVLPQNLKNYLSNFDPNQDHFLGRRFKANWGSSDNYFNSGGAGYVISRSALRKFFETGLDHSNCNPKRHTPMEDVMIAECLRRVFNIGIEDTRDDQQRERFHPFAPGSHFTWRPPKEGSKDWYEEYNKEWGLKLGAECCAPDSVSFHYIKKPAMMRHLHKLLYGGCKLEPLALT